MGYITINSTPNKWSIIEFNTMKSFKVMELVPVTERDKPKKVEKHKIKKKILKWLKL